MLTTFNRIPLWPAYDMMRVTGLSGPSMIGTDSDKGKLVLKCYVRKEDSDGTFYLVYCEEGMDLPPVSDHNAELKMLDQLYRSFLDRCWNVFMHYHIVQADGQRVVLDPDQTNWDGLPRTKD